MKHFSSRIVLVTATVLVMIGCGSNPAGPPPTPQLRVTCPAPVEGQSPDGNPVAVSFDSPTTSGGVAPVNLSCSPVSGSLFSGGTTPVTCSATDSRGVRVTCSTSVFVRLPPRLVGTRLMAFGDSLTAGRYSDPVRGVTITISPFAYPERLLPQLQARYRQQSISMVNEGIPGEMAHREGVLRFRSTMVRHRPDIVLLMMGSNDILVPNGVELAIQGLRTIISQAKSAEFNARVMLATIPPQRANVAPIRPFPQLVPVVNERIRELAKTENVPLADVYDAMKDNLSLIGEDNLHPTPQGFEVIAKTFYDAIVANLEVAQPALRSVR